ncbi:fimbrial protein [Citrobacter amalonaticus]|uniref:Fimbrial protein n=1 Tax=Citrobacter amalonaticus TaxID=35703 RepID=A0A2S4RQ06_CITAM|nr:fimbrial protein [Citrobacter amalonaticus]POT58545.1 fimbrial protein [Citrobacter amalonaticus]POT75929.1 fimbrial protein [Citrobacter amalonaticus]POU59109.1 fimbrial protein [Citrobacter amalonaticus]POV05164.1 fimbrial protein [Citrobacter amalonaticus]
MTLNKAALLALSSSLVLLIAGPHPVQAATTATATVTIKATFTVPPCTLTVPPTVHLGSLVNGAQTHYPVKIDISCPTPVSTVIYGQQVGSSLVAGSSTRMAMTGPTGSSGTPAAFWLTAESHEVDLTGDGATDKTKGFCAGTDNRSCTVTPSTLVVQDTPRGQTTATVRFSVMYP